eukprot:TRINITY_DN33683_c0_g2_i1.p1 TRINITY_DN33683_c0_g2~~TRINITY_DN33683_c0_g2_i1.p1  ORF type:complete len:584 (-),score=68.91 TRINITY_DN33683_c0_g2_i1:8-1723(-)
MKEPYSPGHTPRQSRLRQTGAVILGGGGQAASQPVSPASRQGGAADLPPQGQPSRSVLEGGSPGHLSSDPVFAANAQIPALGDAMQHLSQMAGHPPQGMSRPGLSIDRSTNAESVSPSARMAGKLHAEDVFQKEEPYVDAAPNIPTLRIPHPTRTVIIPESPKEGTSNPSSEPVSPESKRGGAIPPIAQMPALARVIQNLHPAPGVPGHSPQGLNSSRSVNAGERSEGDPESMPLSARMPGQLLSEKVAMLKPYIHTAQDMPSVQKGHPTRTVAVGDGHLKKVWTDGVVHLPGDEDWPLHAIPLFLFAGADRPRPGFREEFRFVLRNDRYVRFGLRLRNGMGDRVMGGTIGIVHSPERPAAIPGDEGQLVTVLHMEVEPDGSITVVAVGDLEFKVASAWMPRGLGGCQLAFVDIQRQFARALMPILRTCSEEPMLGLFAELLQRTGPEEFVKALYGDGPFTVFVPRDDALHAFLGGGTVDDMLQVPHLPAILACHVVQGKVEFKAFYSGRALRAPDGTVLILSFTQWPRGGPRVNNVPCERTDVPCSNGLIHTIVGVLTPAPRPKGRNRQA